MTFDLFSQKLGHLIWISWWMYVPIWKFIDVFVFEIFDSKLQILWPRCWWLPWKRRFPIGLYATGVSRATTLCPTVGGWVLLILAPKYEVDVTTHNGVMAHFTCSLYMAVWPRSLTYLHKNWVMLPEHDAEDMCLFWSSQTFEFLKYSIINCRFCSPVARQPVLPWQPFCAPLVAWSSWCQPPSIKFIGPPSTETRRVLAVYTMCPCDLDLSHFDLGVMSRDATWAMNPCTKFELDTIYRSRVTTTIIFHWPPA